MKKHFLILFTLFVSLCHLTAFDPLAADEMSARYRTGEIDPRIAMVPPEIEMGVFVQPEMYLPKLVRFLIQDTDDDFLKVKRFHDWITDNIAYDTDLFYGLSKDGSRKTYRLLPLKRTTCGGYSRLFKEMADLAGLEAVYISGYAKSYYILSSNRVGNHAWNAVKIKGKWYLVDSTADNRMGYKYGEYSEKRKYQDDDLFIHPDAKIIVNLPYDEKYQFQEKKITLDEFLSAPRVSKNFFKYAVTFLTDMKTVVTEGREEREGGGQLALFDKIDLTTEAARIELNVPDNVLIRAQLTDEDKNKFSYNAFAYKEKDKTVCLFSPPGKGKYTARIMARFVDGAEGFRTVYSVTINASKKGRFQPPEQKRIFTNGLLAHQGIKIVDSELTGAGGYYMIDLAIPDGYSVYCHLRDGKDVRHKEEVEVSYPGPDRKRYYFKMPGKGTYFIKVASKKEDEKYHRTGALVRIDAENAGTVQLPPPGELCYTTEFNEKSVVLVNENITAGKNSDFYSVELKPPAGYRMSCSVKGKDKKSISEHAAYTTNGTTYTFYFTSPGKGKYTARMYLINPEGKYRTTAYFSIDGKAKGEELPLPGMIYFNRQFYEGSLKLISENITAPERDYYEVRVKTPSEYSMFCTLKDENDKSVRGYYMNSRVGDEYTFHFSVPGPGDYTARIYQKNSEGKSKLAATFKIEEQSELQKLPVPGKMYLFSYFYEAGCSLISQQIVTNRAEGTVSITVRCPEGFTMKCYLKDHNDKIIKKGYKTVADGDFYTFIFSPPDDGFYKGRFYVVNSDKKTKAVGEIGVRFP